MQAKFAVTPVPQTQTYSDPTIIQLSAAQLANPWDWPIANHILDLTLSCIHSQLEPYIYE